jgi:hypothetical protein
VRDELATIESAIRGLRAEWAGLEAVEPARPPTVPAEWLRAKLAWLHDLIARDPVRARLEIAKHLNGDLEIAPLPSGPGERRAEIRGRVKSDGLLGDQEAVCLPLVAGGALDGRQPPPCPSGSSW